MPAHLNIVARTNGVGLDRDVDLLRDTLAASGFEVTVSYCHGRSPLRRFFPGPPRFDANIFIERIFPRWLGAAASNFLVPNQERFPRRQLARLRHIDHILCKSHHAREIFAGLGHSAHYIGFTSADHGDDSARPDYQAFFHLAGRSTLKGTETLLALWNKHPEWPTLTLVQCKKNAPVRVPANIRLVTGHIPRKEITHHLNTRGIHLCPSLSEGWGHYIVEAMSCRALVVTTDAPPMNELITPERGILVPWLRSEPRHLGTNFHVDPAQLELAIQRLLLLPAEKKQAYGHKARAWFKQNERSFRQSLPETLARLLPTNL